MQRDMDYVRELLLEIEGGKRVFETLSSEAAAFIQAPPSKTPMSEEEAAKLSGHLDLMQRDGLIDVDFTSSGGAVVVRGLTGKGHDLLVRSEKMGIGTPTQQKLAKKFFDPFFNWEDDEKLRAWLRQQDPDELEQFLNWFDFSSRRDRETIGRQELRKFTVPETSPMATCEAFLRTPNAEIRVTGEHEQVLKVSRELAADLQNRYPQNAPELVAPTVLLQKVFLVHGHDEAAREAVARFLEKLQLEVIILHEQPDIGRTIIEKFESYASQVGFAVVLLTPDDMAGSPSNSKSAARARQNVIFELGYFVGKLGRGRACLMRKGQVEIPSDLYGVIYTDMDAQEGWKFKLVRELKAAGLPFDTDKVWA